MDTSLEEETTSPFVTSWLKTCEIVLKYLRKEAETTSSTCQQEGDNAPVQNSTNVKQKLKTNEKKMREFRIELEKVENILVDGDCLLKRSDVKINEKKRINEFMSALSTNCQTIQEMICSKQNELRCELQRMQAHDIDQLRKWLDGIESQLMVLNQPAANYEILHQQMRSLTRIQGQFEEKQKITSELQRLIIADNDDAEMLTSRRERADELKLEKLLDRWGATFRFVDNRLLNIQEMLVEMKEQDGDLKRCERWLSEREDDLKSKQFRASKRANTIAVWIEDLGVIRNLLDKAKARDDHMMARHGYGIKSNLPKIKLLEARLDEMESAFKALDDGSMSESKIEKPNAITFIIESARQITDGSQTSKEFQTNTTNSSDVDVSCTNSSNPFAYISKTVEKFNKWLDEIEKIVSEERYTSLDCHDKYFAISDLLHKFDKNENELLTARRGRFELSHLDDVSLTDIDRDYEKVVKRWTQMKAKMINEKRHASLAVDGAYIKGELEPIKERVQNETFWEKSEKVEVSLHKAERLKDRLKYLSMLTDDIEEKNGDEEIIREIRFDIAETDVKLQAMMMIDHHQQQQQEHHVWKQTEEISSSGGGGGGINQEVSFIERKATFINWLESIESLLLADSFSVAPLRIMETRKTNFDEMYADVMEKASELEHVKILSKECSTLSGTLTNKDEARNRELELNNLADRLSDAAIFLKDRSQKYSTAIRQLSNHEQDVSSVRLRLTEMESQLKSLENCRHKLQSTAVIQSQMTTANGLLEDARILQSSIDRISETAAEVARVSTESFAEKIKSEADSIAQNWSFIVSRTRNILKDLQDAFNNKRGFEDSTLEFEVWLSDKCREVPSEDGPIYCVDQIEERLNKFKHMLTELCRKEEFFSRVDDNDDEQSREVAKLKQTWNNLKSKVENKIRHYEDIDRLYSEQSLLLNEENKYLSLLQNRIVSSSSVSTSSDADATSAELNSLERLVKEHTRANRDRIGELNQKLEAKRVMIPTLGNQIRQFEFRFDKLYEDALKRMQILEETIIESQRIGKQVCELVEWMTNTEKLLTRAGSIGSSVAGFDSLADQFAKHERILQSLSDKASLLRSSGKIDAARKLEYQIQTLRGRFDELSNRFRQLQRPSDFEPRLTSCKHKLNEVESKMGDIEIRSDEVDIVQAQLDYAIRLYSQLSDLKPEIEKLIKQGRAIVERRQTDRPDETTRELDRVKHQFNELGAKVTTSRDNLDYALKCLRKFHSELALVLDWIRNSDSELKKLESRRPSETLVGRNAATDEELEWIRSTKVDIRKLDSNFQILRSLQRDVERKADKPIISLSDKIKDAERKVEQFSKRLKNRSTAIEDQYEQVETDYQRFQSIYQSIQVLIDKMHAELSRTSDMSPSQLSDSLRLVRNQIDQLVELGKSLGARSDHYHSLAMSDLDNVCRRYDDLKDRYNHMVDRVDDEYRRSHHHQEYSCSSQQQQQRYERHHHHHHHKSDDRGQQTTTTSTTTDDEDRSRPPTADEDEFRRKYARCLAYLELIDKMVSKGGTLPDDARADLTFLKDDFSARHVIDREMIERVIKETERTIHVIERKEPTRARRLKSMLSKLEEQVKRIESKIDNVCSQNEAAAAAKFDKGIEDTSAPTSLYKGVGSGGESGLVTNTTDGYESSDFLYGATGADDHRSVISEPGTVRLSRLDKWMQSADQFRLQPLLRVRSLRAIGGGGGGSSRSQHFHQHTDCHQQQQQHQQQRRAFSRPPILYYPAAPAVPCCVPLLASTTLGRSRPVVYRERIVDKHTATRQFDAGSSSEQRSNFQQQQQAPISSNSYQVRNVPIASDNQRRLERSSSTSRFYHHSSGGNMTSDGGAARHNGPNNFHSNSFSPIPRPAAATSLTSTNRSFVATGVGGTSNNNNGQRYIHTNYQPQQYSQQR